MTALPGTPETYDARLPDAFLPDTLSIADLLKAFGSGVIDPGGAPSTLANVLAGTPGTEWYQRYMQELRDKQPTVAGMGAAVPAVAGGIGYMALRNALTLPTLYRNMVPPGAALRDFGRLLPPSMVLGGGFGKIGEEIWPPNQRQQRPQAAYPPEKF